LVSLLNVNNFVISFTILANPLYDKLTLSRAAQIRKHSSLESIQQSPQLNRSRERTARTPFKPEDIEKTITTVYFLKFIHILDKRIYDKILRIS
jgi:hypothetical protein